MKVQELPFIDKVDIINKDRYVTVTYPCYQHLDKTIIYAKDAAHKIAACTLVDTPVLLLGKGSSGCCVSMLISTELTRLGYKVGISLTDSSTHRNVAQVPHGFTDNDYALYVVDDFVVTGQTISSIVETWLRTHPYTTKFDGLIIGNSLSVYAEFCEIGLSDIHKYFNRIIMYE